MVGVALGLGAQALPEPPLQEMDLACQPKAPSKPLPTLPELVREVMDQIGTVRALSEAYCFRMTEKEQVLNRKGQATESHVRVFEVTYLPGGKSVRRCLSKDGQALSPQEAAAEEARVQATLKALQEGQAQSEVPQGKGNLSVSLSEEDLTQVMDLEPIRRVDYQGNRVLTVAFRPRAKASVKTTGQRMVAKLEGRFWVDEDTHQLVKAEGQMKDSYWVGAGLLGSLMPPTSFSVEQQRVADNLWMPRQGTLDIHARVTFVPVRRRLSFECSDYRKAEVGTGVVVP